MAFLNYSIISVMILLSILSYNGVGIPTEPLHIGFYSNSCPKVEAVVHDTVKRAVSVNPTTAAGLLRLFFHDCFVEGCDGSILIDNGREDNEKFAKGNEGLFGFEVIKEAKEQVEKECPGVVSCADILALAARCSVLGNSDGPFFEVLTGRRDGQVSNKSLANLPDVDDPIDILKAKFWDKGLSEKDLVLLSAGGHTIGKVACFFVPKRLYNFSGQNDSDPAINPQFLPQLKAECPLGGDSSRRLPLDWPSGQFVFDDHIFRNIQKGFALLSSDARLNDDRTTKQILDSYVSSAGATPSFKGDFAEAMVKMGNIGVKTGSMGEIRKVCNAFN